MNEQPGEPCTVALWPCGVVAAIVLLRLVIGWHFWAEGSKKLAYDRNTGELRVAFSAEPMLRTAVGPFAERIKGNLPNFHNWEGLLAVPKSAAEAQADAAERAKWEAEYARRRKAATDKKETPPVEFAPTGPASKWATRVAADWDKVVALFKALPGVGDEQQAAADAALAHRKQQLADYVATDDGAIAEWQHELSRLQEWEEAPTAVDLPFQAARIGEKKAETAAGSAGWIAQVRDVESALFADLRATLSAEQAANAEFVASVGDVTKDANERKLHRINVAVTCLIMGVGACLLLGLFTRVAAVGGIAFLTLVIASQWPGTPGAIPTYNQFVEIAGLLVLLAAGAGRWFGLDFFLRPLMAKCCGRTGTAKT